MYLYIIKLIIIVIVFCLDYDFLKFLPIILPLILSIAFFTLFERKVLAAMQRRRGPMLLGYMDYYKLLLMVSN